MSEIRDQKLFVDIPEIFFSDAAKGPFNSCLNCGTFLLDNQTEYVIEKAIKRYKDYNTTDTIFEYAICMKCHDEIISSYSEESMNNIQNYFLENANFEQHNEKMKKQLEQGFFDIKDFLSHCIIKGTPVNKMTEYQIGCHCIGNKMSILTTPFMIGNEAMDDIAQLLSNKTIDEMDRFIDEFLGLPPDLKKLLKDTGVLIL